MKKMVRVPATIMTIILVTALFFINTAAAMSMTRPSTGNIIFTSDECGCLEHTVTFHSNYPNGHIDASPVTRQVPHNESFQSAGRQMASFLPPNGFIFQMWNTMPNGGGDEFWQQH